MVKNSLLLIFGLLVIIPIGLYAQNTEKSNSDTMSKYKIGMTEALDSLAQSGRIYIEPFHHGSLKVGVYAPKDEDKQKPHDKDEVYVVMSGEGVFSCDGESMSFKSGDVLFVPALAEHRFTEFSDDFKTWVFFYGPEGGEEE